MKDGIYFDILAIKDGVEYPVKRVSVLEVSKILTDSLMDGLGKALDVPEEAIKEYGENQ